MVEGALNGARVAARLIDMRQHTGEGVGGDEVEGRGWGLTAYG